MPAMSQRVFLISRLLLPHADSANNQPAESFLLGISHIASCSGRGNLAGQIMRHGNGESLFLLSIYSAPFVTVVK